MTDVTETLAEDISSFDQLNLQRTTLDALAAARYDCPTPVQAGVIPVAMAGVDVLAQARTGTGKTAAFIIPILERLRPAKEHHGVQALILVPTRELAVQVDGEIDKLSHGRSVRRVPIYGGVPIRRQIEKLRRGVQMVVGTPGRILDHMGRGTLSLSAVWCVVLDEADRMLDIGFRPDIEKILRKSPRERQTLLLSATVPPPIERLGRRYMREPRQLNFSPKDIDVETIEQFYFTVDQNRKFDLLLRLLIRERPQQAIIFCRTRRGTDRVQRRLSKKVQRAGGIHGDMAQRERDSVMKKFRAGDIRCLVATDVVGRGIDVTRISHIINYDIPEFCDDYIHRVGRAGRMGREGVAFTFVTPEEGIQLTRIEMRIDRLLKRATISGFDTVATRPAAQEQADAPHSGEANTEEQETEKPREPLYGRGGRPRKRYRRGL